MEEYATTMPARMRAARDQYSSARLPPDEHDAMLAAFDASATMALTNFNKILYYEAEMYNELLSLLAFMDTRQGEFSTSSTQILFNAPDDALTYNASIMRYRAIATKQSSLREQMQDHGRNAARNLQDVSIMETRGATSVSQSSTLQRSDLTIDIDTDGLVINGSLIKLPAPVPLVHDLLGESVKIGGELTSIYMWSNHGIRATTNRSGTEYDCFEIIINDGNASSNGSQHVYSGTLSILANLVSDVDTARSLNRKLNSPLFYAENSKNDVWRMDLPRISVVLKHDASGLCGSIVVQPRTIDNENRMGPRF
jgi:hypothetical protein